MEERNKRDFVKVCLRRECIQISLLIEIEIAHVSTLLKHKGKLILKKVILIIL